MLFFSEGIYHTERIIQSKIPKHVQGGFSLTLSSFIIRNWNELFYLEWVCNEKLYID